MELRLELELERIRIRGAAGCGVAARPGLRCGGGRPEVQGGGSEGELVLWQAGWNRRPVESGLTTRTRQRCGRGKGAAKAGWSWGKTKSERSGSRWSWASPRQKCDGSRWSWDEVRSEVRREKAGTAAKPFFFPPPSENHFRATSS